MKDVGSPDGLGERLRDDADVIADRGWNNLMSTRTPEVARLVASAREAADRIDTLTEQAGVCMECKRRLELYGAGTFEQSPEMVALRSENARLTEQVRGAEGVVEAARFVTEGDLSPLYNAIAKYDAPSIYDEGAAGGGRSGSASPQSGDEVSQ